MRRGLTGLGCTLAILLSASAAHAQQEIVTTILVQGNTLTPEAEIIETSGLSLGTVFSDGMLAEAAERLRSTGRFPQVDVLKRNASIADPTQVLILIRVNEGPVRVVPGTRPGQAPHVVRRSNINLMLGPIFHADDGYGLTYGVQLAVTGRANTTTRLLFPLSWGGDKRAGAELHKDFTSRRAPRFSMGGFVQRREHPFFRSDADRKRIWGRTEWSLFRGTSAGATVAWQRATLLGRSDTTRSVGVDVVVDTRTDPVLPRNAILVRAAIDRLYFREPIERTRTALAAEGYVAVYRRNVVVLRALRENMNRPVPPFFKSILGGADTLRGFRAGVAIGDTLVAGSAELRIPLTSPLMVAKFGTSVFIDAGSVYDKGGRFRDQRLEKGVGAGVWASAALFRLSLAVAHGIGSGTRVHFGAGLTF